ncbi:hypothetical protein [Pseudogemmobacter bohemicus]|uniref:hypothetical protein n=1 Tax=Pseudogemmobacter bohemicus TaxID=2250708 RepID=UPI000DD41E23|nr:hypothetical protein [Pseudogemmobacter bohemicus]
MTGMLAAVLGLTLAPLMALIGWWRGRAAARKAVQAESEANYAKTRRRMDAAEPVGNDPDAARRWLRERDAARP